ncbi:NusG antitermination factor [[Clostridium] cellulosi]|jgi:transcription antitermination protein nusG|uniref:Transcription termination/antitermination protein NusG n=1 Tax=[Clostridium] cellulosi TaxID=29343 RepID=A0A078KLJ2_9FIRM|nr:MAG: transcription termination/antitermination factor NusG [[Clostridium] cellulosi]CDZ24601.1 NusG antitermination factor [[Clostridium] cellulosi]
MSETAKWYVVHTYSGYENKVASNLQTIVDNRGLQDVIQDIKIPTEKVTEIKDNVKREVERKIFPGYVLVKMELNDETWHIVRNTRGVTGFVGSGSHPEPLTDKEVSALGVDKREVQVNYSVGDSVRIIDGPLDGFIGRVEEVNSDKNVVRVIVSMFGHETPVELELHQIEVIG